MSTDVKVVYETPLRVFAALPRNTSVEFCDYMFPDETLVDSANRFRDLVGIEVDENDIDETVEHVPSKLWTVVSLWIDLYVLRLSLHCSLMSQCCLAYSFCHYIAEACDLD